MRWRIKSAALALTLALAIALGGISLAEWAVDGVIGSAPYRQSKIISSLFSQQDVGLSTALTDPQARRTLLKFAGGLAEAYVRFELIPHSQLEIFSAVYGSLSPEVQITSFDHHGRNLIISGTAQSQEDYDRFLLNLRSTDHFSRVYGRLGEGTPLSFEIECV